MAMAMAMAIDGVAGAARFSSSLLGLRVTPWFAARRGAEKQRQNNGPVTLAAISQRQQISLSYLEQLFGKLRRHELVESTRGPGGGYTLGRKASEITVADIIVSVDEPIDATQCGGKENCLGEGGRCIA